MKKVLSKALVIFLTGIMLVGCAFSTYAADTTTAKEQIDLSKTSTLELNFKNEKISAEKAEVALYKIADVTAAYEYSLTSDFAEKSENVDFTKLNTADYNDLALTLYSVAVTEKIKETAKNTTDSSGKVAFSGLKPGMYLVTPVKVKTEDKIYNFPAFIISLPELSTDGTYNYGVTANVKSTVTDKKLLKIKVVWNDGADSSQRPDKMVIDMYKDGEFYKTITLSAENNWTYDCYLDEGEENSNFTFKVTSDMNGYDYDLKYVDGVFIFTCVKKQSPKTFDDLTNIIISVIFAAFALFAAYILIKKQKAQ